MLFWLTLWFLFVPDDLGWTLLDLYLCSQNYASTCQQGTHHLSIQCTCSTYTVQDTIGRGGIFFQDLVLWRHAAIRAAIQAYPMVRSRDIAS